MILTSYDGTIPICFDSHISYRVIVMEKTVPQKKGSLKGRLLRRLGMNRSLEESPSCQETLHVPMPTENYYSNQKDVKAALLEAERKKAEALMEHQRSPFIC